MRHDPRIREVQAAWRLVGLSPVGSGRRRPFAQARRAGIAAAAAAAGPPPPPVCVTAGRSAGGPARTLLLAAGEHMHVSM